MAKWEINRQLSIVTNLWWMIIPWIEIKVKWPRGDIIVNHDDPRWVDLGGAVWVHLGFSADPNDHYRWWLEGNVGKQGRDWDWFLTGNDVAEDRLTIRIRKSKGTWASMASLLWS